MVPQSRPRRRTPPVWSQLDASVIPTWRRHTGRSPILGMVTQTGMGITGTLAAFDDLAPSWIASKGAAAPLAQTWTSDANSSLGFLLPYYHPKSGANTRDNSVRRLSLFCAIQGVFFVLDAANSDRAGLVIIEYDLRNDLLNKLGNARTRVFTCETAPAN